MTCDAHVCNTISMPSPAAHQHIPNSSVRKCDTSGITRTFRASRLYPPALLVVLPGMPQFAFFVDERLAAVHIGAACRQPGDLVPSVRDRCASAAGHRASRALGFHRNSDGDAVAYGRVRNVVIRSWGENDRPEASRLVSFAPWEPTSMSSASPSPGPPLCCRRV